MAGESEHSERVKEWIEALRQFKEPLFRIMKAMYAGDGGNMFPLDIVMQIAAKRALSTTAAFAVLVEQKNMVSARALLRVQIDGIMRLYAFAIVDQPHDLAMKVMAGEKISRVKDRQGNKMRDAYLVEQLGKSLAWLPTVYDRTSGFIHLSDELIGLTMRFKDEEQFTVGISETDAMPEASWLEVISCYMETSRCLLSFIESWVQTKVAVGKGRPRAA